MQMLHVKPGGICVLNGCVWYIPLLRPDLSSQLLRLQDPDRLPERAVEKAVQRRVGYLRQSWEWQGGNFMFDFFPHLPGEGC